MENRSLSQRLVQSMLLAFIAMWLLNSYFAPKQNTSNTNNGAGRPDQTAPTLAQVFNGIAPTGVTSEANASADANAETTPNNAVSADSATSADNATSTDNATTAANSAVANSTAANSASATATPGTPAAAPPATTPLNAQSATVEVARLQKQIDANPRDEYSQWARLRIGMLQQYFLGGLKTTPYKPNLWEIIIAPFSKYPETSSIYDEILWSGYNNAVTAQAAYQKGDYIWRQANANGEKVSRDGAVALENLIFRSRNSADFAGASIYIPKNANNVPLTAVPAGGFEPVKVSELRNLTDARGVQNRIDAYYQTTLFYKIFDGVVRLFGSQPAYSYGLAIIVLAIIARFAIHPLTKKQYESVKGMQVIAPEMKKIQEKYKNKPEQQMQMVQEIQALQRSHGVNPMLGCGLALIQMPFFFFVVYPMIQHYEAKMELVDASFLWIPDLAHSDMILLILYAISMFVSFRLSSTPPTDPQQAQMQAMMSFMFPLTIPFFLKGYPSAFTMFWMIFNATSTVLQYRLMKANDPQKNVVKTLMGSGSPFGGTIESDPVPPRPRAAGKGNTLPAKTSGVKTNSVKTSSTKNTTKAATKTEPLKQKDAFSSETNGASHTNGTTNSNGSAHGSAKNTMEDGGESAELANTGSERRSDARRSRQRRRH